MDTTNCNLSKIGNKIIATHFCKTWNRILKACIALKPEGDEKWKPQNSMNSDQLCVTSTRPFWKMYRKWKFPNFQIYGFYDFFSSKAWNLPKTLKILFFVLYDITYIQNTCNGNNYLNLPINYNIMCYFFWRVYFPSYFIHVIHGNNIFLHTKNAILWVLEFVDWTFHKNHKKWLPTKIKPSTVYREIATMCNILMTQSRNFPQRK